MSLTRSRVTWTRGTTEYTRHDSRAFSVLSNKHTRTTLPTYHTATTRTRGDSPNRKTRKAKAEKIYSQGIYGPLPCKCVPIVLKELREGDKTSALGTLSVADERVSRDSAPLKYTFDLDPDVVRNSHTEKSAAGDMNPYGPPTEGANNSNPYGTSTFAVHNTQRVDSETDQYTL